jgi:hypothetical protein
MKHMLAMKSNAGTVKAPINPIVGTHVYNEVHISKT